MLATILAIGLSVFLLVGASPAKAGENQFCWGKNLGPYPTGEWICANGTNRLLTGVYASADNGNVCAWSTVSESAIICTKSKGSEGVYNNYNLNGSQWGQGEILHFNGFKNHAYGYMWWN